MRRKYLVFEIFNVCECLLTDASYTTWSYENNGPDVRTDYKYVEVDSHMFRYKVSFLEDMGDLNFEELLGQQVVERYNTTGGILPDKVKAMFEDDVRYFFVEDKEIIL